MSIEDNINRAYALKKKISEMNAQYDFIRSKIQQYFENEKNNKIKVNGVAATKRERIEIIYDIEKMREKIDRKLFNKITERTYFVTDIESLIVLMKEANIKPKNFKKYVKPQIKVNKDAIEKAYDVGDISKDDLQGCYTAKVTKYIELRKDDDPN